MRRRRRLHGALAPLCLVLLLGCCLLGCSDWKRFAYEGFGRDDWQQPEKVVEALALRPGDRIADVGAGSGYFTFRLADAVGPSGRVYAVDVDEDMIDHLKERVGEEGRDNVEVVLGEFGDPLLPDGSVSLLFTSNTFHHIEDPGAYFRRVLVDLRPDGRVAILELNGVSWFPRTFGHFTPSEDIVGTMQEAGYRLEQNLDFVDRQSFLIFARR